MCSQLIRDPGHLDDQHYFIDDAMMTENGGIVDVIAQELRSQFHDDTIRSHREDKDGSYWRGRVRDHCRHLVKKEEHGVELVPPHAQIGDDSRVRLAHEGIRWRLYVT
jgi:hypothetical protein